MSFFADSRALDRVPRVARCHGAGAMAPKTRKRRRTGSGVPAYTREPTWQEIGKHLLGDLPSRFKGPLRIWSPCCGVEPVFGCENTLQTPNSQKENFEFWQCFPLGCAFSGWPWSSRRSGSLPKSCPRNMALSNRHPVKNKTLFGWEGGCSSSGVGSFFNTVNQTPRPPKDVDEDLRGCVLKGHKGEIKNMSISSDDAANIMHVLPEDPAGNIDVGAAHFRP